MIRTVLFLTMCVSFLFAHGAHTLNTTISFQNNSLGEPLLPNQAEVEMQLNWQQLAKLIKSATGKTINETDSIAQYDSILFKTISEQTVLINGTDTAKAFKLAFPTVAKDDLLFGKGLFYRIRYESNSTFDSVSYTGSVLGKDDHYQNHVVVMSADVYPITDKNIANPKEVFAFSIAKTSTVDSSLVESSNEQEKSTNSTVPVVPIGLAITLLIVFIAFRKTKNK